METKSVDAHRLDRDEMPPTESIQICGQMEEHSGAHVLNRVGSCVTRVKCMSGGTMALLNAGGTAGIVCLSRPRNYNL